MPSERFMRHHYGAGNYTPVSEFDRLKRQKEAILSRSVEVTGIWLRRIGDRTEVLFERNGVWYMAIREFWDDNFSHIIEPGGMMVCEPDEVTKP